MTERPILFSAPMVRAILDGRKTQTRRIIKPRGRVSLFDGSWSDSYVLDPGNATWRAHEVRFAAGDRLWVRESFSGPYRLSATPPRMWEEESLFNVVPIWFWADGDPAEGDWTKPKPGIHMPRWASRLTLTVTGVKVERLQEISEADAIAEGAYRRQDGMWTMDDEHAAGGDDPARFAFSMFWYAIHGPGAWAANPWVCAVTFTLESRP